MDRSNMNVTEFVSYLKTMTDEFHEMWLREQKIDSENWSTHLGLADWLEQFQFVMDDDNYIDLILSKQNQND